MNNLLVVDDHRLYREGIRRALGEAVPGLRVQIADSPASALAFLRSDPSTDLCLSDYRLHDSDGLALLECVRSEFPAVARGLLCSVMTPELVRRARSIGCVACLSKDRDVAGLAEALNMLFEGGTVFDTLGPDQADHMIMARRLEILRLAAAGLTNNAIAAKIGIAESSLKDDWAHLLFQLGVSTSSEAVGVAYRRNLL